MECELAWLKIQTIHVYLCSNGDQKHKQLFVVHTLVCVWHKSNSGSVLLKAFSAPSTCSSLNKFFIFFEYIFYFITLQALVPTVSPTGDGNGGLSATILSVI